MATAELPRPGKKCRDCGSPTSKARCESCLEKNRSKYRRRALAGLCVICGVTAEAGAFCMHHWFKNIGSAYGLSRKNGGLDLLKGIWEEQRGLCAVTRKELIPGHNASLDHIIPVSKGGLTVRNNLRWVLLEINRAKADMTNDEFLEMCLTVVRASSLILPSVSVEDLYGTIMRSN